MIYIFRKEMKKWHTVLWIVFVALAFSGVSFFMFGPKSARELVVVSVNGSPVYYDQFRRSLRDVQERITSLRPMAQAYGMSEEMFLKTFLGETNPGELALDSCVKEKLIDQAKKSFNIMLDKTWFKQELVKALPQLSDQEGRINMEMYNRYLRHLGVTPSEYEQQRREDFKRSVLQRFIMSSAYVPSFIGKNIFNEKYGEKKFVIAKFPFEKFVDIVKKEGVRAGELESFFKANKEMYRVEEKRKARYWEIDTKNYMERVSIDSATIRNFYEVNKSSMFRLPPKVKVRHILIKQGKGSKKKAEEIYTKITAEPDKFISFAKEHSQDEKTSKNGGLVDFFSRGTYDPAFERAAFRLHKVDKISPITQTKQGYEIIQLVERIKASAKPLDMVEDEIVKTLKAKRALGTVRSELEVVVRKTREDPKALEEFIKKNDIKEKETAWLIQSDTRGRGLKGVLAQKLFSKYTKRKKVGFFISVEKYVLYNLIDIQKSYIPKLEKIKEDVLKDFYQEKAEDRGRKTLKEVKTDLLNKKITFDQISKKYDASVQTTENVKKAIALKKLDINPAFRERLFALTNLLQISQHHGKENYYLARLLEIKTPEGITFEEKRDEIIGKEKNKSTSLQTRAFIASLRRNAKIEVDKKMFNVRQFDARQVD